MARTRKEREDALAADLEAIRTLDWRQPSGLVGLHTLLGLKAVEREARGSKDPIRRIVAAERVLKRLARRIEERERARPPRLDRSLAYAARTLLRLEEEWADRPVSDLQRAIAERWGLTAEGFRQHLQSRIYDDLAVELRAMSGHEAASDNGHSSDPDAPLTGIWHSTYRYQSADDADDWLTGEHYIALTQTGTIVSGVSLPHSLDTRLEFRGETHAEGVVQGEWTEKTSKGRTYFGVAQFVVDPSRTRLHGKWVGFNRRFDVQSGDWDLDCVTADIDDESRGRFSLAL